MFVPPLAGLEGQGRGSLGGGGAAGRVSSYLPVGSSAVFGAHPHAFIFPSFHQGEGSGGGDPFSYHERCGGTRSSSFSVLLQLVITCVEDLRVCQGDWMVSLNLKEAYLQVPIHPDSCKFLRFVAFGGVYQFRALCFSLSTAPQVFTRVMPPVSSILHSMGIRFRRYLDDWLIQASSWEDVLCSLETVLSLCLELGIVVNPAKSNFVPAKRVQYLDTVPDSVAFKASPSQQRVEKLLSIGEEFCPPGCSLLLLGRFSSEFSPSLITFCAVTSAC